jgi:hypothetical protein
MALFQNAIDWACRQVAKCSGERRQMSTEKKVHYLVGKIAVHIVIMQANDVWYQKSRDTRTVIFLINIRPEL